MKVLAAFNQEKALVGVITNLRMDIRFKLYEGGAAARVRGAAGAGVRGGCGAAHQERVRLRERDQVRARVRDPVQGRVHLRDRLRGGLLHRLPRLLPGQTIATWIYDI